MMPFRGPVPQAPIAPETAPSNPQLVLRPIEVYRLIVLMGGGGSKNAATRPWGG